MVQEQTLKYDAETIALAQARQEEVKQETETEEKAATTDYATPVQKPSVGTVEFFLMVMLASGFWLLALIPSVGFIFSGLGILFIWLWYKFRKFEPPSFRIAEMVSNIAGSRAEKFIKKIPGGSDFLFFFGAFTIDAIPFLDFIPALPALVILVYIANQR